MSLWFTAILAKAEQALQSVQFYFIWATAIQLMTVYVFKGIGDLLAARVSVSRAS
jgi:hypothetical protein